MPLAFGTKRHFRGQAPPCFPNKLPIWPNCWFYQPAAEEDQSEAGILTFNTVKMPSNCIFQLGIEGGPRGYSLARVYIIL